MLGPPGDALKAAHPLQSLALGPSVEQQRLWGHCLLYTSKFALCLLPCTETDGSRASPKYLAQGCCKLHSGTKSPFPYHGTGLNSPVRLWGEVSESWWAQSGWRKVSPHLHPWAVEIPCSTLEHRGRGKAVPQPRDERYSSKHHPSFPPPWWERWNRFFSNPLARRQDRERPGKEPAETWHCHPEPPCAPPGKTHPKPCLCQREAGGVLEGAVWATNLD